MATTSPPIKSFITFLTVMMLAILACGTPQMLPSTPIGMPTTATLPEFPWPPPKPSSVAIPALSSINAAEAEPTLGDVDSRITGALTTGGYDEKSYYGVPGGFALVTRLEQIDPDGYPVYSDRWAAELSPMDVKEFSLSKYLEALFGMPKGHYRIFVFIVTSNLVVQSGTPVTQGEAENWIVEGANKLPSWMAAQPYTKEHSCTVYIYEFIQSGVGGKANQNVPSDITGRQHLERAGLWDILER